MMDDSSSSNNNDDNEDDVEQDQDLSSDNNTSCNGKLQRFQRPSTVTSQVAPKPLEFDDVKSLMKDTVEFIQKIPRGRVSNKSSALESRCNEAAQSFQITEQRKLLIAVCGPRGAGKSEVINKLAVNQSLLGQSLWGRFPLPSSAGGDRVTEAPTYLIHSTEDYIKVVWNNTIISPSDSSLSSSSPPFNPCNNSNIMFSMNENEEWHSECWQSVYQHYGNPETIKNPQINACLNHESRTQDEKEQILRLWVINQFLFSLSSELWFGDSLSHIKRIEIGLSNLSFHKHVTLIDMPGWETQKTLVSSNVLCSIDGVILISNRCAASNELSSLFEYGAFNQSKQAFDLSSENHQSWKPPFLMSMYNSGVISNHIDQSQSLSKVRETFNQSLRQFALRQSTDDSKSNELLVLPHISRWDERAEHFELIIRNSLLCPLPLFSSECSNSISESFNQFVSAIRSETCWSIVNQISSLLLLAQRSIKSSTTHSISEHDATFEQVVAQQSKKLKEFLEKLKRRNTNKFIELVDTRLSETVNPFIEINKKKSKKPEFISFDYDDVSTGIPGYLTGLHKSWKKVIVYDFIGEVIHWYIHELKKMPDDSVDADPIGNALIDQAERSSGLTNADRAVHKYQQSKQASQSFIEVFTNSVIDVKNTIVKSSSNNNTVKSSKLLIQKLKLWFRDEIDKWKALFTIHQTTIINSLRTYLDEINQQNASSVSESDVFLMECKSLRKRVDSLLDSYSDYVSSVEMTTSGSSILSSNHILTAMDRIEMASIPRAEDLYKTIDALQSVVIESTEEKGPITVQDSVQDRIETEGPIAYDVKMSSDDTNDDPNRTNLDQMNLIIDPTVNQPVLGIMKTRFDLKNNTLVLSTPKSIIKCIQDFQERFSSKPSNITDSSKTTDPSKQSGITSINMFGECDQVDNRTLFPMYTICWTDERYTFDNPNLSIHSDWDGLPFCHFLLVEPGEQADKLVNSLRKSIENKSFDHGLKVVVELPSQGMLPQYAIDIGKHIMEYFNFDFCWRVSLYAQIREKHSIKLVMRDCTLARAMFTMQVASSRLFEYVITQLAVVIKEYQTVFGDNMEEVIELTLDENMPRNERKKYLKQERTRIGSLLRRLSVKPDEMNNSDMPISETDILAMEHFLKQLETVLQLQTGAEEDTVSGNDVIKLKKAIKQIATIIKPWYMFRMFAFWPCRWVLQRNIPDFPAIHVAMVTSAYARILVLEHIRPLHNIWMGSQHLIEGIWKSNMIATSENQTKEKTKSDTKNHVALTLSPDDVKECETIHNSKGGFMSNEDGCVILSTSFGVENSLKRNRSTKSPSSSNSRSILRSIEFESSSPSNHKSFEQNTSPFPSIELSPLVTGLTNPNAEQWKMIFQAIDNTNAIHVQSRNSDIGYSTMCARKKLWDEGKHEDATKPLAKRRGKNAIKIHAPRELSIIDDDKDDDVLLLPYLSRHIMTDFGDTSDSDSLSTQFNKSKRSRSRPSPSPTQSNPRKKQKL